MAPAIASGCPWGAWGGPKSRLHHPSIVALPGGNTRASSTGSGVGPQTLLWSSLPVSKLLAPHFQAKAFRLERRTQYEMGTRLFQLRPTQPNGRRCLVAGATVCLGYAGTDPQLSEHTLRP
mmetsp:Transcript_11784/g.21371  ORF Transcript_11784/g.21371 Transcript_11784/m.21371 type:complete len:121 (-) Transcript_11784:921-1283(-)